MADKTAELGAIGKAVAREQAPETPEYYNADALFDGSDELTIPNKDPNRTYRWINQKMPARLMRYIRAGFGPVVGKEKANRLFGAPRGEMMLDANGRVAVAELVLMEAPIALREELDRLKKERRDQQLTGALDAFNATVDSIKGVRGFVTSKEEYDDEKAFDTRESNNRVYVSRK